MLPAHNEFQVRERPTDSFMVGDNKIRLVCTPDEFQGLRYQEWMKGACKLYKRLGRSPEAYLAFKRYYRKYAQQQGHCAEAYRHLKRLFLYIYIYIYIYFSGLVFIWQTSQEIGGGGPQ